MTPADYQNFVAEFIPPPGKCSLVDLPGETGPRAAEHSLVDSDLRTPLGDCTLWQDSDDKPQDYLDLASLFNRVTLGTPTT